MTPPLAGHAQLAAAMGLGPGGGRDPPPERGGGRRNQSDHDASATAHGHGAHDPVGPVAVRVAHQQRRSPR